VEVQGVRVFVVFLWVHSFPSGLSFCLSFRLILFLCFIGFGYTVIWKRIGELRTKSQGGFVAGYSISHHNYHSAKHREAGRGQRETWGWWRCTERWPVYGDTAVTEMTWATRSISSGYPGVDRSHHISCYHTMKIHTLCWQWFGFACSFRDFDDPHNCMVPYSQVVFHPCTLFLWSLTQNCSLLPIPCGFHRCGGMCIMDSLGSNSIISPHHNRVGLVIHLPAMNKWT